MINFKQTLMSKFFILFFLIFIPIIYLFVRLIKKYILLNLRYLMSLKLGILQLQVNCTYVMNKSSKKKFIDIFMVEKLICIF
jgi:hypothetical protein